MHVGMNAALLAYRDILYNVNEQFCRYPVPGTWQTNCHREQIQVFEAHKQTHAKTHAIKPAICDQVCGENGDKDARGTLILVFGHGVAWNLTECWFGGMHPQDKNDGITSTVHFRSSFVVTVLLAAAAFISLSCVCRRLLSLVHWAAIGPFLLLSRVQFLFFSCIQKQPQ